MFVKMQRLGRRVMRAERVDLQANGGFCIADKELNGGYCVRVRLYGEGRNGSIILTPDQARELAKKLYEEANVAIGVEERHKEESKSRETKTNDSN